MQNLVLQTKNLKVGYTKGKDRVWSVSIPDLPISTGQFVGILGANGAGKSTFLKCLLGSLMPLDGTIRLQDKPITDWDVQEKAKVMSAVLTEAIPKTQLTVLELVALGRLPHTSWIGKLSEKDEQKVTEALTLVRMLDFAHKKVYELSDGQLQKVMIARCLAQDTPLVLLDEPTSHLDLVHKVSVFKLLQQLAKEQEKTILFSSHDLDLCLQFCDQVLLFTPKGVYFDEPCNLISEGVFHDLFQEEDVTFDASTGKFLLKK